VPATFGSIAWLVALPRLFLRDGEQTSFVELFALPLQFATLAFVARRPELRFSRGESLAIGILAAFALLLKPTLVGIWIALVLVMVWRERARAIGSVMLMAAGGIAVLALFALIFAMRGALDEMVEQALRYNATYSSFAPLAERLGAISEGLRLLSPSGLAPLALAVFAYALATRRWGVLVLIAVVALPIEMLLATAGRAYNYYFIPWLPAMAVLGAFAAAELRVRLAPSRAVAIIALALLLMAIQPARLVARLAPTGDDGTSRAAAAYLRERTQPTDAVLIWGSHAEVLILAERRSPTRFVYQYAALATRGYATPAAVDELLADLAARPPAYIVDASASSFVTPPLDRAAMRAWVSPEAQYAWLPETERIAAFVETNYVREGSLPVSGWPVFRRR
jgi:hypothetical protein